MSDSNASNSSSGAIRSHTSASGAAALDGAAANAHTAEPARSKVTIVKLRDLEAEQAPEFSYLFGFCVAEAAAVFQDVKVVKIDPPDGWGDLAQASSHGLVLLLGPENVLVRRDSLAAMVNALHQGARFVAPVELSAAPLPSGTTVHTLRDFEDVEEAFLVAGEIPASEKAGGHYLPLSLMPGPAFAQLMARCGPSELHDIAPYDSATEKSRAGLCHSFIDYYGEVRADVLPYLEGAGRDVLEVGCGRGATGQLLQEKLGCRVTGIEMNPVVARAAAEVLHEVIQGDVQTLEFDGRFDVVLALELFEHLVEGERFLERASRWLRPGGRIVLSVPNVGHYSLIEDLLEGRWDYLPIGLLCYTHYRFFTRFTLDQWLHRCGFEQFEIIAQKTELPDVFRSLPEALPVDLESLATSGFFVVVQMPS